MDQLSRPTIVVHCDWSKDARKRWMVVAQVIDRGWHIGLPELVGSTDDLFPRLLRRSNETGVLFVGFDFPIGLPQDYGRQTGLEDFLAAVGTFGNGEWDQWYSVCDKREQITTFRPFYPMRPGGRKKEHLLRGLGIELGDRILRQCERKTANRQAACSLFWTLGGNQVGKGAISGWQEVLQPNLDSIGLWPFNGTLETLFRSKNIIVAETYPGDVYSQIGISRRPIWSKRKQSGRAAVSGPILHWLEQRNHSTEFGLRNLIKEGFSSGGEGEDQFDAAIGLFGMLDVVEGHRLDGCPDQPEITRWEGWILGQESD